MVSKVVRKTSIAASQIIPPINSRSPQPDWPRVDDPFRSDVQFTAVWAFTFASDEPRRVDGAMDGRQHSIAFTAMQTTARKFHQSTLSH